VATNTTLLWPSGVALNADGTLFIADYSVSCVLMLTDDLLITVAGNGSTAIGPAINAGLGAPTGLAFDATGNLFIANSPG
jgi:sugar lactone lactonase YvrE